MLRDQGSSGRNIDVFDVATRKRNGKTICFEAFQVELDSFANESFGFSHAGSRGNAAR